jgi:hypothetical protein
MKVRLVREKPEFSLMSGDQNPAYKIHIDKATLHVHKVKVAPSVILGQGQALLNSTAKYPLHRVEMKSFSIPKGTSIFDRDNIVLGQLPTHIVIGLVDSVAANGSYTKNPFNFQHFFLNYLALQVDSEQVPVSALTPNYKDKNYQRAYQTLFEALGTWKSDRGIDISRDAYPEGYTLYAFNLTANQQPCCENFHLLRQGNLKMEMKFAQALTETVSMIMYLVYENMLEVDRTRSVVYDYST